MKEIPFQEGHISVTGGQIWYRIVGKGPGIPLLTLHGGPGAKSNYLEPLDKLLLTNAQSSFTTNWEVVNLTIPTIQPCGSWTGS